MRLSHWSRDPLTDVSDVDPEGMFPWKPVGLWVSVDGEYDWQAWCETENFGELAAKTRYEIVLAPDANVLHLDTEAAIREFDATYGEGDKFQRNIRWRQIGALYQGIIISPYQWTLRLSLLWYYGWDCASGCIWSASAVKEVRPWTAQ